MSGNRCARGFVFYLVLVITGCANLLFVPVDNDGDESTPPLIINFKFVAPQSLHTNQRSCSTVKITAQHQSLKSTAAQFSDFTERPRSAKSEALSSLVIPLRC